MIGSSASETFTTTPISFVTIGTIAAIADRIIRISGASALNTFDTSLPATSSMVFMCGNICSITGASVFDIWSMIGTSRGMISFKTFAI